MTAGEPACGRRSAFARLPAPMRASGSAAPARRAGAAPPARRWWPRTPAGSTPRAEARGARQPVGPRPRPGVTPPSRIRAAAERSSPAGAAPAEWAACQATAAAAQPGPTWDQASSVGWPQRWAAATTASSRPAGPVSTRATASSASSEPTPCGGRPPPGPGPRRPRRPWPVPPRRRVPRRGAARPRLGQTGRPGRRTPPRRITRAPVGAPGAARPGAAAVATSTTRRP